VPAVRQWHWLRQSVLLARADTRSLRERPMLRPDTLPLTLLLGLLTALGPLAVDMYLPSLPDIGRALGATPASVQLTLSSYLVGFALGQIVYGAISDRVGRRPVLLAALGIHVGASLGCALAPSIEFLIAARGLQALGGAGAVVLARAIVRDLYEGARAGRELSLMGTIMALAPIVAPMLGGIMQPVFGWRANFYVVFAAGVCAVALVYRLLPETLRRRSAEPLSATVFVRGYGGFLRHRAFLSYLAIVAVAYGGLFAWISGASFVLQDIHGLSPLAFSVVFGVTAAGFLLGTAMATKLVVRLGLERTIGLGAWGLAAGGLAMVAAVTMDVPLPLALGVPVMLFLCGLGLALPQAIAGALTPFPDRAGTASSLVGFVQQSFAALAGAWVGQTLGQSAMPLAATIALAGWLVLVLWVAGRGIRNSAAGAPREPR
jgi:DHA1 family bicyclomycin/chloramphenicol resistance-like MFS transporter